MRGREGDKAVTGGQWLEDLYRLKISIALANHSLDLFAQLLVSKGGVGKRKGFLSQSVG